MARKKIFEIQINGIDASVKSVKTLAEELEKVSSASKKTKNIKVGVDKNSEKEMESLKGEVETIIREIDEANKSKITVQVGDSEKEFNNLRQAAKELGKELQLLYTQGQQNTEAYRQLAEAYSEVRANISATTTELERIAAPSAQLVDTISVFQGMTAAASVGMGMKNLFGIDSKEIDETIKTMTSLIAVMQGFNAMQEAMEKQNAFGKLLTAWNKPMDKFLANIGKGKVAVQELNTQLSGTQAAGAQASAGMTALGTGAKAATVGVNLLKAACRTFWLFALIEAIMLAVEWIGKGVKALTQWITGADDANTATINVSNSMKKLSDETERFYDAVDHAEKMGFITELEALDQKIEKTKDNMQDLSVSMEGLQNALNKAKIKPDKVSVDAYAEEYQKMRDSVIKGETKYQKKLSELQKKAIAEYVRKWAEVDKTSNESILKFKEWAEASEVTQDALRNFNELFDGKDDIMAYAEALAQCSTQLRTFGNQLDDVAEKQKKLAEETKKFKDDLETLTTDNTIAAMADGYNKQIAEVRNAQEKALKKLEEDRIKHNLTVEDVEKAKNSIIAKYARDEYNINKEWGEKNYQVRKQIRDNILYAEKQGYALRLQQLRNSQQDEINEARKRGILVKDAEISINKKYNKLIEEEEKRHQETIDALRTQAYRRSMDNELKARVRYQEQMTQIITNWWEGLKKKRTGIDWDLDNLGEPLVDMTEEINKLKNDLDIIRDEFNQPIFGEEFFNDLQKAVTKVDEFGLSLQGMMNEDFINATYDSYTGLIDGIKYQSEYVTREIEDFYQKSLENLKEMVTGWNQRGDFKVDFQISDEMDSVLRNITSNQIYIWRETRIEMQEIEMEMLQILKDYELEYKQRYTQINRTYIDREEALKKSLENGEILEKEYDELITKEKEEFNYEILRLEEERYMKEENLQKKYQNKFTELRNVSINDQLHQLSQLTDFIRRKESEFGQSINAFGIKSYKKAAEQYNKLSNDITTAIAKVQAELIQLGEDSNPDKELAQYLEEMQDVLYEHFRNLQKGWTQVFNEIVNGWKQYADQMVSQLSSFLSTLSDIMMRNIENQLMAVERELEIQEEAYQRAEEAAEAHKDKMNTIEDELGKSRGARREFLIDQLAQQEKAYLEDLAAQQKAAEEKEKLEKKQAALEKKRKEQEKKANIQQALINTYMAVSNALAVQPWFVGLALSAVALAMGMANVASIRSTPVYKDGGLLQGKSHRQGGIKVLGGTAEVEGGEYIVNKKTTSKNLPLLTYVNSQKKELTREDIMDFFSNSSPKMSVPKSVRKFADGGTLPSMNAQELEKITQVIQVNQDDRPIVVSVVDIADAQDELRKVQTLAGVI